MQITHNLVIFVQIQKNAQITENPPSQDSSIFASAFSKNKQFQLLYTLKTNHISCQDFAVLAKKTDFRLSARNVPKLNGKEKTSKKN
jgi:hypothetical protein